MTPDERDALDRQRRIARTPPLAIERRDPLEGQRILFHPTCDDCGSPMICHRVGWECPKCANIEEDR